MIKYLVQLTRRILLLIEKTIYRAKEILPYDSAIFGKLIGFNLMAFAILLRGLKLTGPALKVEFLIHRRNFSKITSEYVEKKLSRMIESNSEILNSYVDRYLNTVSIDQGKNNPKRLIGKRILVVKRAKENEKGVIIIDYSYVFPIVMKTFELNKLFEKYIVVLEPSWSGYCCDEILSVIVKNKSIIIESGEPRDSAFLKAIYPSIKCIPIAANWWVDYREMKPDEKVDKIYDLIMVSAWAKYKRHSEIFDILMTSKKAGKKYRLCLVGYPGDLTKEILIKEAEEKKIIDQIKIYECVDSKTVASLLRQSKIQVLWSKREGFNRAIIEGMLAGVPVILREGFNYGYRYEYINKNTGVYASKTCLVEKIEYVLNNYSQFKPREWVLENMSCSLATNKLNEMIKNICLCNKQNFTEPIVAKIAGLDCQEYFNKDDKKRFKKDYEYLYQCIK